MKILLTNNHLNSIGGSETWVWTVYEELSKNHKVDIFTFDPPSKHPGEVYDLVLCNHSSCFQYVVQNVKYKRITFISHGMFHPLEAPIKGADRYVSISHEVRVHNLKKHNIDSEVILNPVDLDKFYPSNGITKDIRNIRIFCLFQGDTAKKRMLNTNFTTRFTSSNRFQREPLNHEDFNNFDLVMSLGRGCFEGLACGRPVIVYDSRHYQGELYDGIVTNENISNLLQYNCSGRAFRGTFSYERLRKDMNKIQTKEYYRAIAEKYFDSKKICNELIK